MLSLFLKHDFNNIYKGSVLIKTTAEILSIALSTLMGYSTEFLKKFCFAKKTIILGF